MAILKYIPAKTKIIDKRNPDGGYYEATCEVCGTTFYPARASAKYCTSKCRLNHYRTLKVEQLANGGKIETGISREKAKKKFKKEYDSIINKVQNGTSTNDDMIRGKNLETLLKMPKSERVF